MRVRGEECVRLGWVPAGVGLSWCSVDEGSGSGRCEVRWVLAGVNVGACLIRVLGVAGIRFGGVLAGVRVTLAHG